MATAPVVNYYRLISDGNTPAAYTFKDVTTPDTNLDFGIVDAGDDNLTDGGFLNNDGTIDVSKLTATAKAVQAFAVYNNHPQSTGYVSTGTSDMQNTKLSVVSNDNDDGGVGNSAGKVYWSRWIQVLMNDENHDTEGWTSLGFYDGTTNNNDKLPNFNKLASNSNVATDAIPQSGTSDGGETRKELTAKGYAGNSAKAGFISGAANGGTLTGTDAENYALIVVWPITAANAPAGAHYFRLRTTYSYT